MTTHVDCHDIADFAFYTAEAFILIALVMGALMALVELRAKVTKGEAGPRTTAIDPGDIIRALKDAPVWFALFVAGGALIWFAGDTLSVCRP